jgi:hypothetical protein
MEEAVMLWMRKSRGAGGASSKKDLGMNGSIPQQAHD